VETMYPTPQMGSQVPLFMKPAAVRDKPQKRELTPEEHEEIQFAFESLDYEKTGGVTPSQLKVALRAMGFPVKKAEVREMLRRHGEEEDVQRLEFSIFKRIVADKLADRTPQEDMQRAFQLFDVHGMGKLDLASLRKVVKSLGLDIQQEELQSMIDEFDLDKDGMISQAEFISMLMSDD